MVRLRDALQRWSGTLDFVTIAESSAARQWIISAAVLFPLIAGGSFVPGLSGFFRMRFVPAVAVLAVLLVVAFSNAFYLRGKTHLDGQGVFRILAGSTLVEAFYGAEALLCHGRGFIVWDVFMLFMMAFHGHIFRGGLRQPVGAMVSASALALLFPFAPRGEQTYVLLVLAVAGIPTSLLIGEYALRQVEAQRETERMRAALQANMLEQSMSEQERLAHALSQVLGVQHDIANATMTAVLNTEVLRGVVEHGKVPPPEELKALADDIHAGLSRVQRIMNMTKGAARESVLPPEVPVDLSTLMEQALASARVRFPGVVFRLELPQSAPVRVRFRGGEAAVYRVLDNLLVNACEGDGRRGAKTVLLRCRRDSTGGRLEIAVIDDGPGFSSEQLGRPVEGFKTTKSTGTGLGLYTTESLVKASDGNLERKNLPDGGAMVAVVLPLSDGAVV